MKHKLNYKGPYKAYSHTQFQSFTDNSSKQHQQQQQDQHCIVLGTDFKSPGQVKAEKKPEIHKPMHQFFGVATKEHRYLA